MTTNTSVLADSRSYIQSDRPNPKVKTATVRILRFQICCDCRIDQRKRGKIFELQIFELPFSGRVSPLFATKFVSPQPESTLPAALPFISSYTERSPEGRRGLQSGCHWNRLRKVFSLNFFPKFAKLPAQGPSVGFGTTGAGIPVIRIVNGTPRKRAKSCPF